MLGHTRRRINQKFRALGPTKGGKGATAKKMGECTARNLYRRKKREPVRGRGSVVSSISLQFNKPRKEGEGLKALYEACAKKRFPHGLTPTGEINGFRKLRKQVYC